ncbi:MAG: hypothetical protein JW787_03625 [Sedimentisphaerales bacterium]|nr:hypothetical protein [Sedimentisphaerales bacterium]
MKSVRIILFICLSLILITSGCNSMNNPRGRTVQNLRVLQHALEEYQQKEGKLPQTLDELDLADAAKLDGNGNPFLLVNRDVADGYPAGRGHFIIVGMSEPATLNQSDESWWYAIVIRYPGDNKLVIDAYPGIEGQRRFGGIL